MEQPIPLVGMVRLADPSVLEAHRSRFDVAALPRAGLSPLEARSLDALVTRPYVELSAADATHALDLVERTGYATPLFAYFLPALLRRPPLRDRCASERLLAALLAARGDPLVAEWGTEVDETLSRFLAVRPLRGGDDPVDLWLSEAGYRRFELQAARRFTEPTRTRGGLVTEWERTACGPIYARTALAMFQRSPSCAERRFLMWESASEDSGARAWVEVMFHVHGEGWRPEPASLDRLLDDPRRAATADAFLAHPEIDVAIGAAAVAILLAPRRARETRARIAPRLLAHDASDDVAFVLVPAVRRLLTG